MKIPKRVYLYICDRDDDGDPIFAVATMLADIPEDQNGQKVGEYKLVATKTVEVRRELH